MLLASLDFFHLRAFNLYDAIAIGVRAQTLAWFGQFQSHLGGWVRLGQIVAEVW